MKLQQFFGTSRRTRIFTVATIALILCACAVNFLLTGPMQRAGWRIDNTYEKLYTPTSDFIEACEKALSAENAPEVTMTFCADPDTLSKTATYRVTYYMALALQKRFDNFTVKTVNITENPTAVAKFKTTSRTDIASDDVILSATYGDGDLTYRIEPLSGFWVTASDGESYYSYDGEYRLVTLLYSVMAVERPTAYFITGHGETVYDVNNPDASAAAGEVYDLLLDSGLKVKTLNLSEVSAVPDDCVLLILNNPTTDFIYDETKVASLSYQSELEKLDRYLIDRQGAMIVAKDHRTSLPNLEVYLNEWGFSFRDVQIKDTVGSLSDVGDTGTILVAQYDTEDDSYGDSIYHEISSYASAARTVFSDCGDIVCSFYGMSDSTSEPGTVNTSRVFAALFKTTENAVAYAKADPETDEYLARDTEGERILVATSARIAKNSYSDTDKYSYVCCASTSDFLSNDSLGNTSFANRDVLALLIRNISRVDEYASDALGGGSLNSDNMYGKVLYTPTLNEQTVYFYKSGDVITETEVTDNELDTDSVIGAAMKILHPMTSGLKTGIAIAACTAPLIILAVCAYVLIRRKNR